MFSSCENELTKDATLNVNVMPSTSVTSNGDTITVKKGVPVEFQLNGDPDFITFFSGEPGIQYEHKDRTTVDEQDIEESQVSFSIWNQYGVTGPDLLRVYISDHFDGLNKNNFEQDSILAESHDWSNLIEPDKLPQTILGNSSKAKHYEIDLKPYLGKRIAIAIRYHGVSNTATQTKVYFESAKITNKMKNGQETNLYPSSWGLTALNMNYKAYPQSNADLKNNPAYGTVKNNTEGYWNLVNAGQGSFFIHSTGAGSTKPVQYSWLISDLIVVNSCSPDTGIGIKNMTDRLPTYTYQYNTTGIYKATFVGTNVNYKHESTVISQLIIQVTN
jgi:hypothetical protein